jgi:hypothetical protein
MCDHCLLYKWLRNCIFTVKLCRGFANNAKSSSLYSDAGWRRGLLLPPRCVRLPAEENLVTESLYGHPGVNWPFFTELLYPQAVCVRPTGTLSK